jgi:hypothetical protein
MEFYAKVKAVPFHFYKNVRTFAFKVGIRKSTIHDASKKGLLKHTRNTIRPILTDINKADMVVFCCSFVQDGKFIDMLERVDIDGSCNKIHPGPWGDHTSSNMQTRESH